jgi:hypothetical protein
MSFLVRGVDEMRCVESLAHQLADHVGHGDHYGVDPAGSDLLLEQVEGESPGHWYFLWWVAERQYGPGAGHV